jgi:HAD superfamily hydrolase (TIGR01509 family)
MDDPTPLDALPGFAEYQSGEWDEERYLPSLAMSLGIEPSEAARAHNAILIEPYPGAHELVCEIEESGIRTAVLSNTNTLHWTSLVDPVRFPTVARIALKMASHEVGFSKPDPRIFQHAAEFFGFAPGRVAFFDDSPANVEAANSVGWEGCWIDPFGDPSAQMRRWLKQAGFLT